MDAALSTSVKLNFQGSKKQNKTKKCVYVYLALFFTVYFFDNNKKADNKQQRRIPLKLH